MEVWGNGGAWTWTRMISVAHLNRVFPRLTACFGPNPGAAGAVLMLLIQAVITFSHGHFFCLYTVFITDFQLFIFFPLSLVIPPSSLLIFPGLLVLFFICSLAFSSPLIPVFPECLSDLDKDPEDQTLSPSLDYFGISLLCSIFSPPFAPADFSAPPSSFHRAPWCLFCYRMRNKNVVPLLLLIYLPCPGE